jgi:hypothetical protein
MPAIQFYASDKEVSSIIEWLEQEESIRQIIVEEKNTYRAIACPFKIEQTQTAVFWHKSSVLPKQQPTSYKGAVGTTTWNKDPQPVDNPEEGWVDPSIENGGMPTFNDSPAVFRFQWNSSTHKFESGEEIYESSFQWIGAHYSILGATPNPDVKKWWQRLRRRMTKMSSRLINPVPHHNSTNSPYILLFPDIEEKYPQLSTKT